MKWIPGDNSERGHSHFFLLPRCILTVEKASYTGFWVQGKNLILQDNSSMVQDTLFHLAPETSFYQSLHHSIKPGTTRW